MSVVHAAVAWVENNKVVCGLALTAGIVTMPRPGTEWSWKTLYQWLFDGLHQFLNMKRPTPPAEHPNEQTRSLGTPIETPAQPKP